MKKYIAEALGTAALTLVVGLSLAGSFPVPTPVLAALTLGLFVYSIGHISGTHINPAVTVGLWSIGKISNREALNYLSAQLFGSVVALSVLSSVVTMPTLAVDDGLRTGLAEMIGVFFFTFGIAAVVYGRVEKAVSGLVIGGSLLIGISISVALGGNGVLNPAVALGIGSLSSMYVLGPLVGAVLGMKAYKYLQQ